MDHVALDPASRSELGASSHAWLKALTADAHERAEEAVMRALAPLTYERYADYLERVLSLYGPLEAALWSSPELRELVHDASCRRKVPWLLEDLAALDRSPARDSSPPALPSLASPLEQLGAAYVLEGATLGGGVLLARLRASGLLLSRDRHGTRFLSGYGSETAARWQAFRGALQGQACSHEARAAIGAGALATFRAFEAALSAGER